MSTLLVLPPTDPQARQSHAYETFRSNSYHRPPTTMSTSSGRKRKAEDEFPDTRMGYATPSPSPTPILGGRAILQSHRQQKRPRTNLAGRQLSLPRLLETLNPQQLRGVLRTICDQHPDIGAEIINTAPAPSVSSALGVLASYQAALRDSFPYGDKPTSDYAYNRVRQALTGLIDALRDYTPHFLPPHEQQSATSLEYLDRATNIVHQLPNWDSFQHNLHKQESYEEMSLAWSLVVREAAKKGGGIQLQYNGWDEKLAKHNELAGGRMQAAVSAYRSSLGWMEGTATGIDPQDPPSDVMSIRQQLMKGTYGTDSAIQVGPW